MLKVKTITYNGKTALEVWHVGGKEDHSQPFLEMLLWLSSCWFR